MAVAFVGEVTLRASLRSDPLTVVAELQPPDGTDLAPLIAAAERLRPYVDTIQLTDMPRATPHMDNLAATAVLRQRDLDVMVTMTCRDRNVVAQQARLIGAAALGASSVFCITGDPVALGDHPQAREVFELTSSTWLACARQMREQGTYLSGRAASPPPNVLVGAALGPHGPKEPIQDACQKAEAGAEFFMTQPVFDCDQLAQLLNTLAVHGVVPRCPIVAGIAAPASYAAARWLDEFPGIRVPDTFLERLRTASSEEQPRIGLELARELTEGFEQLPAVRGVLVYPVGPDTGWLQRVVEAVAGQAGRVAA